MSIVVRFAPKGLTAEQYDEVVRLEQEQGGLPTEGRDYHVCFGNDGELLVSEIWDSQEAFEAFAGHLMPLLEKVGIDAGQPTFFQVHSIERR